jgi:hypothetical protein
MGDVGEDGGLGNGRARPIAACREKTPPSRLAAKKPRL